MEYRVSVITSLFKSEKFLPCFLNDIRRQSIFHEVEFIFIDANNGPSDRNILEPFFSFKNVKYENVGNCYVYEAWNKGIEISTSPLLSNWNTDDRRKWDSLERQAYFLEQQKEYSLCYGKTLVSDEENENFDSLHSQVNKKQIPYWPAFDFTFENQMRHNSVHCLPMWRKDAHEIVGQFDTQYFSASDYDMWFKFLKADLKGKFLDEFIGVYYENPTSISRNPKNLEKAVKEVLKVRKLYS